MILKRILPEYFKLLIDGKEKMDMIHELAANFRQVFDKAQAKKPLYRVTS